MNIKIDEFREWKNGARRELRDEADHLASKMEQINNYLRALDVTDDLLTTIDRLEEELEEKQTTIDRQSDELDKLQSEMNGLRQQLQDEKERNQALEMRLSEMSKLSAGVAKKSSQEELMKALRIFINKSKQKRIEKRMAVKEMVLELANANAIIFPADLAATLDSLDDEQPDTKVVHVAGNYNDVHDNDHVEMTKQKTDYGRK